MAKIQYVRSRRRGGKGFRRVKAAIDLSLDNRPGGAVFVACVSAGMGPRGRMQPAGIQRSNQRVVHACVSSKNPRRAIAAAMRSAAALIEKRSGAFAGLRRK